MSVASLFLFFYLCRNSFQESVKQIGSAQHQGNAGGLGTYETVQHFNDIKEHLHMVKRDVEHLVQRSAQVRNRQNSRWNRSEISWPSSLPSTEPSREGGEVPRAAPRTLLLIHRSFHNLHRHPVGLVFLLHHVQVRHLWFGSNDPYFI